MLAKLEYLIALAAERNFGRAAARCGIAQPSFSAGIRALEDQLGVPLVLRSSRFQGFTAEGELVLDWARRITGDTQAMRDSVRNVRRGLTGLLRITAVPTALASVHRLTVPYAERHPLVRFSVISAPSAEVLARLQNNEADAGITYLDDEPIGRARTVPLYEERYRLLTAADGPGAGQAQLRWAELEGVRLCLLTPDMQNRRIIDGVLRQSGVSAAPALESNSLIVLASHVRTGRYASVMPAMLAELFAAAFGLRAVPLVQPEEAHRVGLVVPDRDPLSPLVEALVAQALQIGGLS